MTEEEVKQKCDKEHNKQSNCLLSMSITINIVKDDDDKDVHSSDVKRRFQLRFETHPYLYEGD